MISAAEREVAKNRVREAADIVQVIGEYVELKKAGSRFSGLCPFHAEKTASFSVNPQGQFFHCFGCGESGDVFSFIMKYSRLSFPEALKDLAHRYHIDLPEPRLSEAEKKQVRQREKIYQINEQAARIYQEYLAESPAAQNARDYLVRRGAPPESVSSFRLGYAPDPGSGGWNFLTSRLQTLQISPDDVERAGLAVKNDRGGYYDRFRDRILFPITDYSGRVVAFGGRILGEGKPKYLNSPESPVFDKSRLLFGLYQHRQGIRTKRKALVVEGNFDLLLLAAHGFDNVVAPLGTALTASHIRSLRGYCDEVILLFDGDSAGLKAALRSVPLFLAEQVDARIALLPDGHDPDSLVRAEGPGGIERLVEEASPLAEFVFADLVRQHGLTLEGKSRIAGELRQVAAAASDRVQRSLMIAHFSEQLGISPDQFTSGLQENRKPVPQSPRNGNFGTAKRPRRYRQLIDFLVFYPEFLSELLTAGLEEVVADQTDGRIIAVLRDLAQTGLPTPERLLSALPEGGNERHYVAQLLITGYPLDSDEDEQGPRIMCNELLSWLQAQLNQRKGADLLQQINEAQQAGDQERLMKLLQLKQEMGKQYHA